MSIRSLAELDAVDDPAWPSLAAAIQATPRATLVPPDPKDRGECQHRLQVSSHSTLGAMARHVGMLRIDHGWLRLYGAGAGPYDPGIAAMNGLPPAGRPRSQPDLIVGSDVLGGVLVIGDDGQVHYWAPDALTWEELGAGYTDFVHWTLSGGSTQFYADQRWTGWEAEVASIRTDQALSLLPPLWMREAQQDVGRTHRQVVPFAEAYALAQDFAAQLDGGD